ncbi:MAG: hypothetical protein HY302_05060 [Opitutae bacterium]|nr:hypothetical protein [Opitutae bacterium]
MIAQGLLGLIFTVFGLNMLVFLVGLTDSPPIKLPTLEGDAGAFMSLLVKSKIHLFVKILEFTGGVLLLASFGMHRYAPVAIVMLGPIVVNIFLFQLLLMPFDKRLLMPIVQVVCLVVLVNGYWSHFQGIFAPHS